MPGQDRRAPRTRSTAETGDDDESIDIVRAPGVDGVDNTVNLIGGHPCPGYVIGPDSMALNHCLSDKEPIFQLDIVKPHQVSACRVYRNSPEVLGLQSFVLFYEHIDDFAPGLTESYEEDPHSASHPHNN